MLKQGNIHLPCQTGITCVLHLPMNSMFISVRLCQNKNRTSPMFFAGLYMRVFFWLWSSTKYKINLSSSIMHILSYLYSFSMIIFNSGSLSSSTNTVSIAYKIVRFKLIMKYDLLIYKCNKERVQRCTSFRRSQGPP